MSPQCNLADDKGSRERSFSTAATAPQLFRLADPVRAAMDPWTLTSKHPAVKELTKK